MNIMYDSTSIAIMNEMYYLHDYDIDNTGTRLVYLRKVESINSKSKCDEMDIYLRDMIHQQFPKASENIELIAGQDDIDKWDKMLLNHYHLTANYRCATFFNFGTMITINYASLLVPLDVPINNYVSVGHNCSMRYGDYKTIILEKSTNPPMQIHQHPLVHGIVCYRVYEVPYNEDPEEVFFMYHYQNDYIRAVVNVKKQTVTMNCSNNFTDNEHIQKDLDEWNNGLLMSLSLNKEKKLFQKAKQILMNALSSEDTSVKIDFKKYLQFVEEI